MNTARQQLEMTEIPPPAWELVAEATGIDGHIDTIQRVLVMGEESQGSVM
ncbi:MAG: hypothetical protein ABSD59_16530 [Terracidiphilus sp.]|jgi:N-glycosylase/DNA lyase